MKKLSSTFIVFLFFTLAAYSQTAPTEIQFVRQGVKRVIFDQEQSIPLASLNPEKIIGLNIMHPIHQYGKDSAKINIEKGLLNITANTESESTIWLAGFNPFATYIMDLGNITGAGKLGFQFADPKKKEIVRVSISYAAGLIANIEFDHQKTGEHINFNQSIYILEKKDIPLKGKLILQMLGSGLTLYLQNEGLPTVLAQMDFAEHTDLREIEKIRKFQTSLYAQQHKGTIAIKSVDIQLNAGMGLADIRTLTYETGEPIMDQGRLWFSMSVRGRALPHHLQGIFSMDPSLFDIKFEGIVVFDRGDGLWRNEVASHIFFDRRDSIWRGITTGFSAYANKNEKKQLLAVESKQDPRFGFSIMKAKPMGQVGDIEDPHIIFDKDANKWRILTCENSDGYKAIILESDVWAKGYKKIAGPVQHNSTGTSIQRINGKLYCFSGSSEKEVFIYSYPDLKELGHLNMDLPPWDETSNSRVWPNVIELPEGYPTKYIALMMDRFNYPGLKGPNWTYGALYLYHGYEEIRTNP